MKVIVLTGLVSIEKGEFAVELARHYKQQGLSVTVIDNIARQPINHPDTTFSIRRIEGDILPELSDLLREVDTDVVLVASSEQVLPEALFVTLDKLYDDFDKIEIRTLALIDTRTCDCFPHVREQLEQYADEVVRLPYQLEKVLRHGYFA
jgi:hypothetical protein